MVVGAGQAAWQRAAPDRARGRARRPRTRPRRPDVAGGALGQLRPEHAELGAAAARLRLRRPRPGRVRAARRGDRLPRGLRRVVRGAGSRARLGDEAAGRIGRRLRARHERGTVARPGRDRRDRRLPAADAPHQCAAAPPGFFQQHTSEYRNPATPRTAPSSSSAAASRGARSRRTSSAAGRDVYLSVGACPWVPRSHRGRDLVYWMDETGLLDQTVDTLTAPNALVACNPAVSGTEGGHDCNPHPAGRGAVPVGRLEGFSGARERPRRQRGQRPRVRGGAPAAVRRARRGGAGAASADPPLLPELRELDLAGVGAIVWATGFRPDYGWIELPVLGDSGRPVHRRGSRSSPASPSSACTGCTSGSRRSSSASARTPSTSSRSSSRGWAR